MQAGTLDRRPLECIAAAALLTAVLLFVHASFWTPALMLIVPALAAWAMRRVSLLATVCLTYLAVCFGGSSIVLGRDRSPYLVALVVLWSLAIMLGALLGRGMPSPGVERRWLGPRQVHIAVAGVLVAVSAMLVLTGQAGYAAQITTGVSTPTGLLGTLSTAAPTATLMVLVSAIGAGKRIRVALMLAGVQTLVLSLSGFRGAGVLFAAGAVVAGALVLPASSPWRQPRRLALIGAVLAVGVVGGFGLGATVRSDAAAQAGIRQTGGGPAAILGRVDLGDYLTRAVSYDDDPAVQEAVSWQTQVAAIIPRALWPDKPIVDYGLALSEAAYGLHDSRSSSTISTLGDVLVNWGLAGVIVAGAVFGMVLGVAERYIRRAAGTGVLIAAATLSTMVLRQETPLILGAISTVRDALVVTALWAVMDLVAPRPGVVEAAAAPPQSAPVDGRHQPGGRHGLPPLRRSHGLHRRGRRDSLSL